MIKIDMTGRKYGKLTVLKENGKRHGEIAWLCQCECGQLITVNGYALRKGHTQSCGCYAREQASKKNTKHGLYSSRLHSIYFNMKNRCYNPNYYLFQHYGGKGITVCDEWLGENGLINFYKWANANGYSEKLSIDRKDNSLGYSPANCRWVTMRDQQNNRTNNRIILYNGESHTMAEWARLLGMRYSTLQEKLKRHDMGEIINANT